jgi:Reverse transcriptase (RNA-dependent DNA polymerase)
MEAIESYQQTGKEIHSDVETSKGSNVQVWCGNAL